MCEDCDTRSRVVPPSLYEKLKSIYFDKEGHGEDERRLRAYNLLILEWQSQLTSEQKDSRS